MARKPLGPSELANSEWAKHLKPYGKRLVNGGQRRDGKTEIREINSESQRCHICREYDYWGVCQYCDKPACRDHGYACNAIGGNFVCTECEEEAIKEWNWFQEEIS